MREGFTKEKIPLYRLEIRTSRSGGPGGQNVNKTETKVEVRFALSSADWVGPPAVRERLALQHPGNLTREGEFLLSSDRFRSQRANLEDCLERLADWIETARPEPIPRRATKPTRASKKRRLEGKSLRARVKKNRGRVRDE